MDSKSNRYYQTVKFDGLKDATGIYEESEKYPLGNDILHIESVTGYLDYGNRFEEIPNNMICMISKNNEVYLRYTGDYSKVIEAFVTVKYWKKEKLNGKE